MTEKNSSTRNFFLCGIGGQGVLLASELLSTAAFKAGYDVKKSEVHGMAQRGGSVTSHVRYGEKVYSPLIPPGEVHYLVAFHPEERDRFMHLISGSGKLIFPPEGFLGHLPDPRCLNTGLSGYLSAQLDLPEEVWEKALELCVKPRFLAINREAFWTGRRIGSSQKVS